MSSLWLWVAVAGAGALHGLNPATGWMFAAAWGVRSRDRTQALRALRALRALLPIAVGHAASVLLVATAIALGLMDRIVLQALAGGLLIVVVVTLRLSGRALTWMHVPAGHVGLALCSFMMSTAHGAGLMLAPALIPLCVGDDGSAKEITASGSLALALAAVGVHTVAMLVAVGAIACGLCRGFEVVPACWKAPGYDNDRQGH